MESNSTERQYTRADLQLSQPHFDDETTLLSARRVVPLGDLRAKARSGRRLGFGFAIVFAVMIGAFGATLIYKQRDQKQTTAIVETKILDSQPVVPEGQPLSVAGGSTSTDPAPASSTLGVKLATGDAVNNGPVTEPRKAAPIFSHGAESGRANERWHNVVSNHRDESELRRAELIEARRFRRNAQRETKREARPHKSQSSNDLLRIMEIFEGSPKP